MSPSPGAWPWPSEAHAFPRGDVRFAQYADGTREERPMAAAAGAGVGEGAGASCASHARRSSSYDARTTVDIGTSINDPTFAITRSLPRRSTNLFGSSLAPAGFVDHQFTRSVTRCPRNALEFFSTPCQRSPANNNTLFLFTPHAHARRGDLGASFPVASSVVV